jgi:hypothetical protein
MITIDVTEDEAFLVFAILIERLAQEQESHTRHARKNAEILQRFLAKLTPVAEAQQKHDRLN